MMSKSASHILTTNVGMTLYVRIGVRLLLARMGHLADCIKLATPFLSTIKLAANSIPKG